MIDETAGTHRLRGAAWTGWFPRPRHRAGLSVERSVGFGPTEKEIIMSLPTKALFTVASIVAGHEIKRLMSDLELDDLLRPVGLERRRSHLGGSLLYLSAGVALGGAAVLVFSPSKRRQVAEWLSREPAESQGSEDSAGSPEDETVTESVHAPDKSGGNNQPPIAANEAT